MWWLVYGDAQKDDGEVLWGRGLGGLVEVIVGCDTMKLE